MGRTKQFFLKCSKDSQDSPVFIFLFSCKKCHLSNFKSNSQIQNPPKYIQGTGK